MTFWLDAHLDPQLAAWIGSRFKVIVKPLREIGLREADDVVVFEAARRIGEVVVITKDDDFVELVRRRGKPPQILWLTCGNLSTLELQAVLARRFAEALVQLGTGVDVFEISS